MELAEKRWREGSGQRYLKDGVTIRCQGRSKAGLRAKRQLIREEMEFSGYDEEAIDLRIKETKDDENFGWPECQCIKSEIPGTYVCYHHGGPNKAIKKRDITDITPVDLKEKMDILRENPDYLSQKLEIIAVQGRFWQLIESLEDASETDVWKEIILATDSIESGDIKLGLKIIRNLAEDRTHNQRTWIQVQNIGALLSQMRKTEVSNMKDLRQMVTEDQLSSILDNIYKIVDQALSTYIQDEDLEIRIMKHVGSEIAKLINAFAY